MRRVAKALVTTLLVNLLSCAGSQEPPEVQQHADNAGRAVEMPEDVPVEFGIRESSSKPRRMATFAYDCDDSSFVVATLDAETGGLWVFLEEGTVLLPHVPSASGAHYSNGTISFWSKGLSATIDIQGVSRRCTENRPRSIVEDAKLRGNDFWATGNEPGWQLEMGPAVTVLRTNYGQTIYTMHTPVPQVSQEGRQAVYEAQVEGVSIRIVIEGAGCRDNMSGQEFESSVLISLGDETFYGCGQALH